MGTRPKWQCNSQFEDSQVGLQVVCVFSCLCLHVALQRGEVFWVIPAADVIRTWMELICMASLTVHHRCTYLWLHSHEKHKCKMMLPWSCVDFKQITDAIHHYHTIMINISISFVVITIILGFNTISFWSISDRYYTGKTSQQLRTGFPKENNIEQQKLQLYFLYIMLI